MKQEERTELTRKKIMKAAVEEFGRYGYEGGTIGRICRTGISKGLIYHNFKDKDDLYLACLKESCDLLMDMCPPLNQTKDPKTLAEEYMTMRMRFFSAYPAHGRILFEGLLIPSASLEKEIHATLEPLETYNRELFNVMLDRIHLRKDMDREKAATYFQLVGNAYNTLFRSQQTDAMNLEEKIRTHEKEIPLLIDCMLYGVAEEGEN